MQTDSNNNMNFFFQHKDLIHAGIAGIGYTTVTLSQIDLVVKISAGLIYIGYIVYKWVKDAKHNESNKN